MGKIEKMNSLTDWERELALLENKSNLRKLPVIRHLGREVEVNGKVMLNLSSNDYLGLAAYLPLRTEFLQSLTPDTFSSFLFILSAADRKFLISMFR